MRRKLYLETFGCQMNVLDSELVLGQLRAQGYDPVESRDDADVILYNTCSVREHAEQKVWSRLGELRERKQAEPGLVIGVIGCMAERDGTNLFKKFPHVDVLCGPGELDKLPGLVHNAVVASCVANAETLAPSSGTPGEGVGEGSAAESQKSEVRRQSAGPRRPLTLTLSPSTGRGERRRPGAPHHVALMGSTSRRSSTLAAAEDHLELLDLSRSVSPGDDVSQAYVRITRGCNKFCTYCVVPYTRGPEVHRPPQNIIDEVKMLVDAGAREVTLLGQTINHYCYAHGPSTALRTGERKTTFGQLLYQIHEAVPHLPRLRFVTSFPRDFDDEALQAMRDCDRICRYLHVPAQHGNDRILKLMNRGYTSGQYREFIARARAYMPDISIASDFIVGFPTETDEEFEQSLRLIGECRFKNSFIFKYSPRPGTVAIERFADDVPEDVKRRRNNALLAEQQKASESLNREMIGKRCEVMVEGESKLVSRRTAAANLAANAAASVASAGRVELAWETRTAATATALREPPSSVTQLVGRTRGDQIVCFDGDRSFKGQLLTVHVTDAKNMTLFGKLVHQAAHSDPT